MRRPRCVAVLAGVLLLTAPLPGWSAEGAVTALLAKTPVVESGGVATFLVGVTSTDAVSWAPESVAVTVELLADDNAVVATSSPFHPETPVAPSATVFAFVDVRVPAQLAGAIAARATVTHDGTVRGTSDLVSIAVNTLVAAPPATSGAAPYAGQFNSNEVFAARSAQSGTLALTGKYDGDRSFQANLGLSSTPGQQRPVATVQTAGAIAQLGTFSPSLDALVFSGATGSGAAYKRVWSERRILQLATISGAHATANPFTIDALSYAVPLGAGTLTATYGDERVDGEVPFGAAFFMRSGTLAGLSFTRPADARGFSYGLRYGTVNYLDALSGIRRTDRAVEGTVGFSIRRTSWTFDLMRAGPYFPNLAAPSITPDRESESLQGSIPVGALTITTGINGYRDALPGSPSLQKTHVWTENVGANIPLRNGDALTLNISNGSQHRLSVDALTSGSDNTSIAYTARRGLTTYALTVVSANQRDSSGTLQHTIQDGIIVSRAFGPHLQVSVGANLTGNHASAMTGTSLLQAFMSTASYTVGDFAFTSSLNRSTSLPFLGTAPVPTTALNYGVTLKPRNGRTSLSATMTQNHAGLSSSNGSLNLSRQI